jgi:hypothetical protein
MAHRPTVATALRAALQQPRRTLLAGITTIAITLIACGQTLTTPPPAPPITEASSQAEIRSHALEYVSGSTAKVEQLIGDYDVATKQRTYNQTASRYGIWGSDLGNSFEHNGRAYFLFGDTIGKYGGDVIGVSDATDPSAPLGLDFLTNPDGSYLRVELDGIAMDGYNIPVAGISLDGAMYVAVKTNYTLGQQSSVTLLTHFDEATQHFTVLRELSRLPNGRFITLTMREAPPGLIGLPDDRRYVLVFGTGEYRRSDAYLMAVPVDSFETGEGTLYYTSTGRNGPNWTETPWAAAPIIDHPTIGDISFSYIEPLATWVALYDSRSPRGLTLRSAPQPWGPWSAPQVVWDPRKDAGYGSFIYDPNRSDNAHLAGPIIPADRDPFRLFGGFYAPYIIERLTRVEGEYVTLQYVLSTWNPYVVVRMQSTLRVAS